MRLLPLIAILLAGCSSSKSMKLPWNTRAQEQARLNAATVPKPQTREEELLTHDPNKEFPLTQANVTGARTYATGKAGTGEFRFANRVRSNDYRTHDYATNAAQMGELKFDTKDAKTKESWFSKLTARSKSYDTNDAREAKKEAPTKALPDGERPFLVQGRRQADFDRNGPASQIPTQSWEGDLTPMTIEDVRKLLNKN